MSTRAKKPDLGDGLEDVTGEGGTPPAPQPQPEVTLPDTKTKVSTDLKDRMVFIYGPEGIGKSTLASGFGDYLFFECEPGLVDLEVYRQPIGSWDDFRRTVAEAKKHPGRYQGFVIDTYDALVIFCRAHVNARLGIAHESDADWGKGYDAFATEMQLWLARLWSLPGGMIVIAHSQEVEIKNRRESYNKVVPAVGKRARRIVTEMADLVLLLDMDDDTGTERRIIRTKPSKYWDAKERGNPPRLPETIDWPLGAGFEVLRKAWDGK